MKLGHTVWQHAEFLNVKAGDTYSDPGAHKSQAPGFMWRQIFVDPQFGTCILSLLGYPEF